MKTPQNAPFCIKSAKQILGGGGGANPTRPLPPFPGMVDCTAKKASYAPVCIYTVRYKEVNQNIPDSPNTGIFFCKSVFCQSLNSYEHCTSHVNPCIFFY